MDACTDNLLFRRKLAANASWNGSMGFLAWRINQHSLHHDDGRQEQVNFDFHRTFSCLVRRLHLLSSPRRLPSRNNRYADRFLLSLRPIRFSWSHPHLHQQPTRKRPRTTSVRRTLFLFQATENKKAADSIDFLRVNDFYDDAISPFCSPIPRICIWLW